jgi:WD40 repeat protein
MFDMISHDIFTDVQDFSLRFHDFSLGSCLKSRNFFQLEGCGSIFSVLHLRQNILASGSDDSTVRLWDIAP